MNKINKQKYLDLIEKKAKGIQERLESLTKARNSAESAMTSRYDTQRESLEMEITQQEKILNNLTQFRDLIEFTVEKSQIESGVEFVVKFEDGDSLEGIFADNVPGLEGVTVVTFQSPLGKAMFGKKVGDKVTYQVGEQTRTGLIEAVA